MRALSPEEVAVLRDLAAPGPDDIHEAGDPRESLWESCADRGAAVCTEDDEWLVWSITDLGRLALRVHEAFVRSCVVTLVALSLVACTPNVQPPQVPPGYKENPY